MLSEFAAFALDSRPQHADVLGGGGYSFLPLSDELRQRSEKTLLKTKSFGSASVGEVYSFDGVKNNCKEERKLLCHLRTSAIVAFLKHFKLRSNRSEKRKNIIKKENQQKQQNKREALEMRKPARFQRFLLFKTILNASKQFRTAAIILQKNTLFYRAKTQFAFFFFFFFSVTISIQADWQDVRSAVCNEVAKKKEHKFEI